MMRRGKSKFSLNERASECITDWYIRALLYNDMSGEQALGGVWCLDGGMHTTRTSDRRGGHVDT